jgi:putative transposase
LEALPVEARRNLVAPGDLSVRQQCQLLGLDRSGLYYQPVGESQENQRLMRLLDKEYTRHPVYGVRRMTEFLRRQGEGVNAKRVRRLLRLMGLEAIYPKPRLSVPDPVAGRYPYLLRGLAVERPDQVWCADITYIGLSQGWAYLVVVMDWFSRYVLGWEVSNTLESGFCVQALDKALRRGRKPQIHNTDQGSQFTSAEWIGKLEQMGARISLDGRGRAFDNIFIERLWRTVKYEHVYLHEFGSVRELRSSLGSYLEEYNEERFHQGLANRVPAEVYGR